MKELILDVLDEHISMMSTLRNDIIPLVEALVSEIVTAFQTGNKVMLFGNGGSAADAQHLAAEFVGRFYLERMALPALALHANTSSITAIGNDYSFDHVFSRQLQAFGRQGDVVIGITTSGNSANVIEAIHTAKAMGMKTVAFTGQSGGKVKDLVDYCFCAPSDRTPRIQEAHITVGHILCELIERQLFSLE